MSVFLDIELPLSISWWVRPISHSGPRDDSVPDQDGDSIAPPPRTGGGELYFRVGDSIGRVGWDEKDRYRVPGGRELFIGTTLPPTHPHSAVAGIIAF